MTFHLDCSAPSLVEAETNLQKLVDNVTHWISTNRLVVNTKKSKTMLIGTRQNVTNHSLIIYIHNSLLEQTNSFKLLGVIFDSNLSLMITFITQLKSFPLSFHL